MRDNMNTALTIVSMAVLMPLCVIAGIYVGHTLTIKSPMPESLPDMAQLLTGFKLADSHLWIEKVPKFVSKLTPASAVATLHENYGIIQGLAYATGYALHRVEPKVWQEPLGLGGRKACATGPEWKRKLKSKAQELYPHLDVTLGNADALLILHYANGGGR